MPKKAAACLGILVGCLWIASAGFGQIIENPAKPTAKDAGRVLKLTEVWRIKDEGGEFYFQYPHNLQVSADGSIFLADREEFLKFSPEGQFLKNIYKKGQGPGEIEDDFMYFICGGDIFIQDLNSRRFWRADFDGILQEQVVLKNKDSIVFIGVAPDGFLFLKVVWPPRSDWTGKLVEVLHVIDFVAKDGSEIRDIATFKPKSFLSPQSATSWDSRVTALSPDGKLLYAFHGRDYLIEIVDLTGGANVRRFRRTYPKVPYVERGWEANFRKKSGAPKIEYKADVRGLYPFGNRVWVETSTDDKTKGRLIDVFDKEGRFVDSFYLGAGRALMAVREGFVFTQEKAVDETITIVKYRVDR